MKGDDLIQFLRKNPLSTGAGLLALVLAGILYLRGDHLASLQEEYVQLEKLGEVMETNRRNAVNLESHVEELQYLTGELKERMFRVDQTGLNLRYFYGLEETFGVRLRNIRQMAVEPPPLPEGTRRRARDEPPEDTRLFVPIPFEIEVVGPYSSILAYIRQLEKGEHFARVTGFQLQRAQQTDEDHVLLDLRVEFLGVR